MYQCGHVKSRHDFFSVAVFLRSTCCHQSVSSSAKFWNTKEGLSSTALSLLASLWPSSSKGNLLRHQCMNGGVKRLFWENTKVLRTNMRRIYKVPFSDFTPIPTYFRILIAHSSLLQLNVITGPLPHLFLYQKNAFNCHTNIYCLPYTFLSILRTVGSKIYKFKWGPNFFHTQQQVAF